MYYFLDWDEQTREELDIRGEDYDLLIDLCFRYCKTFSFRFPEKADLPGRFPFKWSRVPDSPTLGPKDDLLFSETGPDSRAFFKTIGSFFEETQYDNGNWTWITENLCFYREDGSLFLWSITHEGVCVLNNREKEDVLSLCANRGWEREDLRSGKKNIWIPQNIGLFRLPLELLDADTGGG